MEEDKGREAGRGKKRRALLILVQRLSDQIRFPAERDKNSPLCAMFRTRMGKTPLSTKMDISSEGIKKPEPVADHSSTEYGVLLALL